MNTGIGPGSVILFKQRFLLCYIMLQKLKHERKISRCARTARHNNNKASLNTIINRSAGYATLFIRLPDM
jgi:hypothetical protein